MSMRPQLAVLAVLAAGGAAFGAYFLWPSGRDVGCARATVPNAAKPALAAYAGRIRHDVSRSGPGDRQESWSDPLTRRIRQLVYEHGKLMSAFGMLPGGHGYVRTVWVLYEQRRWMSHRQPLPRGGAIVANEAALGAQGNRDLVARGKAIVVGTERLAGRTALHLRRRVVFPHQPAFRIDLWVDPLTYVTLRIRTTARSHASTADETWLPRTPANVAATRITVPAGFRHLRENAGSDTFSEVSSARRC